VNRIVFIFLVAFAALATTGFAGPLTYELPDETADLKAGPGAETAVVCLACHSADYISTQPSNKGKAFWEAEVQKMIKVYQAPIDPADAPAIADYLAANY
jgi:sulfite dehydrogenase (cytochrome) subunit B